MADKPSKKKSGSKDDMTLDYHTSPPAHAYGEGGPETNTGKEGPDTMPKSDGRRKEKD